MKLKLDENLPRDLRATLRRLENDVSTVAEEGLLSQPDPVIGARGRGHYCHAVLAPPHFTSHTSQEARCVRHPRIPHKDIGVTITGGCGILACCNQWETGTR